MNQSDTEDWEFEGFEFKKGSFHYETSKPYRLWYEYLRLSPIYLLAHKQRTTKGGLTEEQKKLLDDSLTLQAMEGLKELGKSAIISRKLQAIIPFPTYNP